MKKVDDFYKKNEKKKLEKLLRQFKKESSENYGDYKYRIHGRAKKK